MPSTSSPPPLSLVLEGGDGAEVDSSQLGEYQPHQLGQELSDWLQGQAPGLSTAQVSLAWIRVSPLGELMCSESQYCCASVRQWYRAVVDLLAASALV